MKRHGLHPCLFENPDDPPVAMYSHRSRGCNLGARPPTFNDNVAYSRLLSESRMTRPKEPVHAPGSALHPCLFLFGDLLDYLFIARVRCLAPETNKPGTGSKIGRLRLLLHTPAGRAGNPRHRQCRDAFQEYFVSLGV